MVYRPTARVLTVLELLQSHGRMTGAELARRLEVDIRTIRNYVETLMDLGIPVQAERGRYGAYRLRPGYKLPPLIFTEDESFVLTLSLLIAREQGLAQTSPALEGILAKVMRVLPQATRTQVQAVEQTVLFEDYGVHFAPSMLAVAVLSSALQSGQRVRLCYRSAQDEVTERGFDPYGIVSQQGIWYTIGYCHLRKSQRLFRLDRIEQAELTDETFSLPDSFDARTAVQRALATVKRVWQIEVWLAMSLQQAQRSLRLPEVFFEEKGEGILFRCEVADLPWMAQKLAGMGVPFVIKRPEELREVITQYAHQLENYAQRVDA